MISIAARLMDKITQAAQEAYPNECCGMLAGTGDLGGDLTITRVQTSTNVAEGSTRDRFEVDPKVRFDLMRQVDDTHERIIGHYHSHPDHPAKPSAEDLKMAFEPELLWLIIGLDDGHINEVTAHRINADATAFQEMPLAIDVEDPR